MRRLIQLAVTASLFALWAPAANAQRYPDRNFDQWHVYGYKDKCWMISTSRISGSILSFSTVAKDRSFYIGLENREMTWLKHLQEYKFRVQLGKIDTKTIGMGYTTDEELGPLVGIFMPDFDRDYLPTLIDADRLKITRDGGPVMLDMPLAGSEDAIAYFKQCDVALRAGEFADE